MLACRIFIIYDSFAVMSIFLPRTFYTLHRWERSPLVDAREFGHVDCAKSIEDFIERRQRQKRQNSDASSGIVFKS